MDFSKSMESRWLSRAPFGLGCFFKGTEDRSPNSGAPVAPLAGHVLEDVAVQEPAEEDAHLEERERVADARAAAVAER